MELWSDKHRYEDTMDSTDPDKVIYNLYEDIQCLKEDITSQQEAWEQHMQVSVGNAQYILELEWDLKVEKRAAEELQKERDLLFSAHAKEMARADIAALVVEAKQDEIDRLTFIK